MCPVCVCNVRYYVLMLWGGSVYNLSYKLLNAMCALCVFRCLCTCFTSYPSTPWGSTGCCFPVTDGSPTGHWSTQGPQHRLVLTKQGGKASQDSLAEYGCNYWAMVYYLASIGWARVAWQIIVKHKRKKIMTNSLSRFHVEQYLYTFVMLVYNSSVCLYVLVGIVTPNWKVAPPANPNL